MKNLLMVRFTVLSVTGHHLWDGSLQDESTLRHVHKNGFHCAPGCFFLIYLYETVFFI